MTSPIRNLHHGSGGKALDDQSDCAVACSLPDKGTASLLPEYAGDSIAANLIAFALADHIAGSASPDFLSSFKTWRTRS